MGVDIVWFPTYLQSYRRGESKKRGAVTSKEVGRGSVRKTIGFWQKYFPTSNLYGFAPSLVTLESDRQF